jgi:hypothetical protein
MAPKTSKRKRSKNGPAHPDFLLLPRPKRVTIGTTVHPPAAGWRVIAEKGTPGDAYAVEYLRTTLPQDEAGGTVRLRLDADVKGPQGVVEGAYRLEVRGGDTAVIAAADERGLYYGACTLEQLLTCAQARNEMPDVEVLDWPDMAYRMVMFDLARNRDFVMDYVKGLIDQFSRFKVNMVMLYLEYRYAFRSHRAIGQPRVLTAEQSAELDAYARRRFVELIPQVNCLGHFEGILNTEAHKHRAEDFGKLGFQLCPSQPGLERFLEELYRDVTAPFSTGFLHAGGDESWELAACPKCRARAARIGKRGLYLQHMLMMHKIARRLGKRLMLWGDMILEHRSLAAKLPKDIVIFDWHYTGRSPETLAFFRKKGFDVFVCPATNVFWSNFVKATHGWQNVTGMIADGHAGGAVGECTCCWELSQGSHFEYGLQHLALSAECAWNKGRVEQRAFVRAFSQHFLGHDGEELWAFCTLMGDEMTRTCRLLSPGFGGRKMRRALIAGVDPFGIRHEFFEALDRKVAGKINAVLKNAEAKLDVLERKATRHREVLPYLRFPITMHRAALAIVQGLERARLAYARAAAAQDAAAQAAAAQDAAAQDAAGQDAAARNAGDERTLAAEIGAVLDELKAAGEQYGAVAAFCKQANAEAGAPQTDVDFLEAKRRRLEAKRALIERMAREKLPLIRWELLVQPLYEIYDQANWQG